jgi:hypothetical protein
MSTEGWHFTRYLSRARRGVTPVVDFFSEALSEALVAGSVAPQWKVFTMNFAAWVT